MKALMIIVLLVSFAFGAEKMGRDRGSEVVVSKTHGLVWTDTKDSVILLKSQADAALYCEQLKQGGSTNWRLPSIEEFETIVDKTNYPTNINRAFKYSIPDGYWSNNVKWRTLWFYADYMHFISGTPYYDNKHKLKRVRCVRPL